MAQLSWTFIPDSFVEGDITKRLEHINIQWVKIDHGVGCLSSVMANNMYFNHMECEA